LSAVTVRFVGCGDAFGSGGRLQACILLKSASGNLLLDCGASSLIGMKRLGIDPNEIGAVVISHLHGDHFGGLPFLILDGQFSRRELPLAIAGPPGTRARVLAAMEVFFPGSSTVMGRFHVEFIELEPMAPTPVGAAVAAAFEVEHASGAPAFALRLALAGSIVAYSGDTSWTPSLLEATLGADLFICEAYFAEKQVPFHLAYRTLIEHAPELGCRRVILTHMTEQMLAQSGVIFERAEDGLDITV